MSLSFPMRFMLAVLATWRVTHLLAEEDGPWDVIVRLRMLAGQSVAGQAMDCFYCLSLWISAPLALIVELDLHHWVLIWPALSGAACLLEQMTTTRKPQDDAPGTQGGL